MTTTKQKVEIIESLNTLDASQSESVLDYIKGLVYVRQQDEFHQEKARRHQAMTEINQALGQLQKWM